MFNLRITQVGAIVELDSRKIEIHAIDEVRGDIILHLSEDEARWLWAGLDPKVKGWRQADGDDA